jgi:hypothetical protein
VYLGIEELEWYALGEVAVDEEGRVFVAGDLENKYLAAALQG